MLFPYARLYVKMKMDLSGPACCKQPARYHPCPYSAVFMLCTQGRRLRFLAVSEQGEIGMSFRGINTTVIQIRRQVFTEVARMAYANVKGEQANHLMRKIPYTIIPGEEGKLRKDIFLERAIVEERVRLAMGLPTRRMDEHNSVVSGLEDASIADKYYDPPLVNVIKFACNRCPEKLVKVSDLCQGCLAHPCMEVCPKKAITWESGRSTIDQDKCIKCGRCVTVCPYNAIVKTERPCAAACGMGAIHSDELGRAEIDYSKCVSCGQCLVNCPFGAIADKGQIYQLIQGFNRGDRIYALVAPAFINQFPSLASTGKLKSALKAIGFCDVVEVAIGADLCTVDEAHDFLEEVPEKLDFMATSCCPAWSMMAKTAFPGLAKNISMTMTPMVFTARMMKQADPDARMCFIGPCAAKKLEASRRTVRSDVDFVLTFEELAGIIEAKDLDLDNLEVDPAEMDLCYASAAGRGFAQSGGVAKAVADKIKEWRPDMEVKIASAQGLADCKKLLMLAKAGKYNGYLLEGMGCPGGCIGGAGTIADPVRTAAVLNKYVKDAEFWIRKSARRHGLSTDASYRFERGVDPNGQIYALKQAAILCKQLAGGKISMQIKDVYPEPMQDFPVRLNYEYAHRLIGKEIGAETIKNIATSLEMKIVKEDAEGIDLLVPAYRVDVQRPCDVVEDILRIYGYNNVEIPTQLKSSLTVQGDEDKAYHSQNLVAEQLVGEGFMEILNNSLSKASYYTDFDLNKYPNETTVKVMNPLSADLGVMRQTMLFGGLESVVRNINHKSQNLKFFEVGNTYIYNKEKWSEESPIKAYSQEAHMSLFITGKRVEGSWAHADEQSNIYELKAVVENILRRVGMPQNNVVIKHSDNNIFSKGVSYETRAGKVLVELGILSLKLKKAFDIEQDVFYADIHWDNLMKAVKKVNLTYTDISKYPSVSRDLALLVDKNVEFAQIEQIAHQTEKKLLKSVVLFDVYEGEHLPEGKKSYAVNFILQDEEKTLNDKQIDAIMKKLIANLTSKLNAELR